ncbi:hypothetical protein [Acanthopleuribacter pedis]|uniref:Uncharacterized protein n=1 Tax=Acanthopleuribacter pedis TaxID=442870 RepID=A0A8J7Q4I5_9BACT|nr:hypothetical protein [Acanthopleuribacter pedis]MBO1317626.1 hypothetical protein [Acanthopleuribacter pedis]
MSTVLDFMTQLAADPRQQADFAQNPEQSLRAAGFAAGSQEARDVLKTRDFAMVNGSLTLSDPGPDPLPDPDPFPGGPGGPPHR